MTSNPNKILLVDDSNSSGEIQKGILKANGYDVELVLDGIEALRMTSKTQYDLIVTDLDMPNMDGFTLIEKLRKDDDYIKIPIIIISSREEDDNERRGIELGANAYIFKGSFDQTEFLNTISGLLEKSAR